MLMLRVPINVNWLAIRGLLKWNQMSGAICLEQIEKRRGDILGPSICQPGIFYVPQKRFGHVDSRIHLPALLRRDVTSSVEKGSSRASRH
jgi:hypothetical protein